MREIPSPPRRPRPRSRPRFPSLVAAFLAALPLLPLLLLLLVAACRPSPAAEAPPEGTPRLVVMVVSDQFRGDYLERARPFFSGGLARLADEGVVFTRAHHGHSTTSTAPGHATLATGSHPARHGIVGNGWVERTTGIDTYCVEDPGHLVSPANLETASIGDWLKGRYPRAKVVSASGKDRGAVFAAGRSGDEVYWYDHDEGGWTTSSYYAREIPAWLADFNAAGAPTDLFYSGWEPVEGIDPGAAAAAGFEDMDRGPFEHGFPHLVGSYDPRRDDDYWSDLYYTPVVDEWLGSLARELVVEHDLGGDEWPDLLALSFSAVDTVGHGYGPHSREVLDTLVRLDRSLGELFALLDDRLGRDAYLVAFSSDHGVAPLPERPGEAGVRVGLPEVACVRRVAADLEAAYGDDLWLEEPWYLDHGALEAAGHDPAAVAAELAAALEGCPHVAAAWTWAELEAVGEPGEPAPGTDFALRYRNNHHPERSPDVEVQWTEGFLPSLGSRTTHGSPYAYDTHVPIVLLATELPAGVVEEPILTVDLAPTLAALLDVPTPEVDGRDRHVLAGRAQPRPVPAAAGAEAGDGKAASEGETVPPAGT